MVLLQAVLFWYLSEAIVFPAVVVLISLPAVVWKRRWEMSSFNLPFVDLGLATVCAMKWYLVPHEPRYVTGFVMYPLVHAAGQFFLLVQVARLWFRRLNRPLPVYLPLLAVLVLICLGDIDVTRRQRRIYENGVFLFVALSFMYYAAARFRIGRQASDSQRWGRLAVCLGMLLLAGFVARISNSWLLHQWSDIERIVTNVQRTRNRRSNMDAFVGFSAHAPLGSLELLRSELSEQVALRVLSTEEPGYLRGAVFDVYTGTGWESDITWTPLSIERRPLPDHARALLRTGKFSLAADALFAIKPFGTGRHRPMTIWRESVVDQFMFLPLGATGLQAVAKTAHFDRHGLLSTAGISPMASITVWTPELGHASPQEPIVQTDDWGDAQEWQLSRDQIEFAVTRLTQLPPLDPRVVELAQQLFQDCATPAERVQAVRRYFSEYRYESGIRIPPNRNPLTYFLLRKPPASCEFFASGAAVLLRLGGVPTRYVTGFAGGEYNAIGRYWIVRQREAHAWVEAYLPDRGWTIVDATPSGGIPPTTQSFRFWDEINLRGQMIRSALATGGIFGTLSACKHLLLLIVDTVPGRLMITGVLFLFFRNVRFRRSPRTAYVATKAVVELRRLLAEMDRRMRRLRLERSAYETLHQFAERLKHEATTKPNLIAVANWYLEYAKLRYGDAPETLSTKLRSDLQAIKSDLDKGAAKKLP